MTVSGNQLYQPLYVYEGCICLEITILVARENAAAAIVDT